jgi:hypothetical protein
MNDRRSQLSSLVALVAVLGAGCAGTPDRTPPVPVIEQARDARQADPCRLLSDAQLGGLGLAGPGNRTAAEEGPRCEWRGGTGVALELTLFTDGGGLELLADNSEPTTRRVRVSGYPALETFTGRGEFCQYDVGIAETQVVMVAMDALAPDSCSTLQRVVPMVAANLPRVRPA